MRDEVSLMQLPRNNRGGQNGNGASPPPSFGKAPTFGAPPGQLPPGALQTNNSLQPMPVPAFGAPPMSARGGPGFPGQGPGMQGSAMQGQQPGAQGFGGPPGQPFGGTPLNVKQAAIETVLSMPRPDAAALWLAKQDVAKRAGRQSLAVLVALAVLTAVCVAGLATILYLKLVATPAVAAESDPAASSSPVAAARSPGAPTGGATSAPIKATATPAGTSTPGGVGTPTGAVVQGGPVPVSPAASSKPGEEPGYLTIICKPFCDDVRRGGASLGPSPIVKAPVPPGQHRIVLTRAGSPDKVISVLVASGEVRKETITMK